MTTKELRSKLDKRKGEHQKVLSDIKALRSEIKSSRQELVLTEKAHEIIKQVGIKTQQQIQYHISDITSLAMEAVFPDPYKIEIEFVERRNKTECDIYFSRDGKKVEPMDASGGGAVDVAAFALRIACWSMSRPHSRSTIIMDEPMRFVSEDLQEKASQMIKEISRKLSIQFIIVTHSTNLAKWADKVFEVSIRKRKSIVKSN